MVQDLLCMRQALLKFKTSAVLVATHKTSLTLGMCSKH